VGTKAGQRRRDVGEYKPRPRHHQYPPRPIDPLELALRGPLLRPGESVSASEWEDPRVPTWERWLELVAEPPNDEHLRWREVLKAQHRPGDPPDFENLQDRADTAWAKAGLERITPHECRHTFASLMIAAGVNAKALSTFMGHANISITLDRYGHLMPGSEAEAAGLLDAYLAADRARAEDAARSGRSAPSHA
jgi:Phage integrase family